MKNEKNNSRNRGLSMLLASALVLSICAMPALGAERTRNNEGFREYKERLDKNIDVRARVIDRDEDKDVQVIGGPSTKVSNNTEVIGGPQGDRNREIQVIGGPNGEGTREIEVIYGPNQERGKEVKIVRGERLDDNRQGRVAYGTRETVGMTRDERLDVNRDAGRQANVGTGKVAQTRSERLDENRDGRVPYGR